LEGLINRQLLPGLEKVFDETLKSIEVESEVEIPPLPTDGDVQDPPSSAQEPDDDP